MELTLDFPTREVAISEMPVPFVVALTREGLETLALVSTALTANLEILIPSLLPVSTCRMREEVDVAAAVMFAAMAAYSCSMRM